MREETVVPENELSRQYYYAGLLKPLIEAEAARLGRPYRFWVTTLGCQMNAHDSEKIIGILKEIGAEPSPAEEEADLVLYNTCCVRENAEQRVFGRLGYLKSYKKKRPEMKIALCGCMMQEPHIVEKIRQSYPQVDLIFGTYNFYRFAELFYRLMSGEKRVIDLWTEHRDIVEDLPTERKQSFKACVNIMYGCDNFCTYCIVPYVRGRERSRRPEDILREVRGLAASGVKEIQLLGQNVNSYGKNLEEPVSFAELLEQVCAVPGLERVRFMTSHPKDLSDELIACFARLPKLMPHFHLPLQSGSDRLLKAMNRHYDKARYLELCEKLRAAVPDMAITTDIIVGFPGETREDFLVTLDVVRRVRFNGAFTFIYSRREGTPAAKMPDQVPPEESQPNFDELLKLLEKVQAEDNRELIGRSFPVLAEEWSKNDPGMLTGRTPNNSLVHFYACGHRPGDTVEVRITESAAFYLTGEALS